MANSLSGPSSRTQSGATSKLAERSDLLMSAAPIEPYRWPSSLACASIVTLYLLIRCAELGQALLLDLE
jgi:hypothetical protein